MTNERLDLLIAMAKDWMNPAVCRDAPNRVPHVIEQLIDAIQELRQPAEPVGLPALQALRSIPRHAVGDLVDRFQRWDRSLNYDDEYVRWADVEALLSTTTPPTRVDGVPEGEQ